MHTLLERFHAASSWLLARGTLDPKRRSEHKHTHHLLILVAALLTLLAIVVLLTFLIALFALINLRLALVLHQSTDLIGARRLTHQ